jgi:hypothetical protein
MKHKVEAFVFQNYADGIAKLLLTSDSPKAGNLSPEWVELPPNFVSALRLPVSMNPRPKLCMPPWTSCRIGQLGFQGSS